MVESTLLIWEAGAILLLTLTANGLYSSPRATYSITEEERFKTPYRDSPLFPYLLHSLARQRHCPSTKNKFDVEYDYIVVGSGAGGSAVAARLSEVSCIRVLLLEAGKRPPLTTDIPGATGSFFKSEIDWGYQLEPQKYCGTGLTDRRVMFANGKAIGGSTILNAMFAVRGNKLDYERWSEMGAKGWSYDDVLPYFKKLENNTVFRDPEYHGVDGPITVEGHPYVPPVEKAIFGAARELGYTYVDSNGQDQSGFFAYQINTRNSQRCSAAKGYLVPVENSPNLDIIEGAFVKKVLIKGNQAVGVLFDYRGKEYKVLAKREVIVSAGSILSPKLLMLSGIGPREHLEEIGIPVVVDLPVGQNLQDHVGTFITFQLSKDVAENSPLDKQIVEYINARNGPMAIVGGVVLNAFLNKDGQQSPGTFVDTQIIMNTIPAESTKALNINQEVYDAVYKPYENQTILRCSAFNLHPKSRGFVKLRSSDPYDPPVIDPMYLKENEDIENIVGGLKTCLRIGSTNAMQSIGVKPNEKMPPECEQYSIYDDEGLRCITKSIVISFYHPVGTAKMGDVADISTVVDPKLRVKYLKGLRVVDASVMPYVTSGNTNFPTMMIGEKAADIIKEEIECPDGCVYY